MASNPEPVAAINPYALAFRLAANRLRWDLSVESFRSRARLASLRNGHRGEKAVILCNGPSLLSTNFAELQRRNVFTFGLNKINLLFAKNDFRPSAIVAVNRFVIEQNAEFYNHTDIPLYLDGFARKLVKRKPNITFLHSANVTRFAGDCSISVSQGHTVTFVALQLAFHMGFSAVALVGCDHTFAQKGPPNKVVSATGSDPSHFDPNYFSGGVQWQLPDLAASEVSYELAARAYEGAQRRIVNCTDGGKLEIFPRADLISFLDG